MAELLTGVEALRRYKRHHTASSPNAGPAAEYDATLGMDEEHADVLLSILQTLGS